MATQTSDVSDDGAVGSRQSRHLRVSPPQRLDGATSISPRQTSPAGRGVPSGLSSDLAMPGQSPEQELPAGRLLPLNERAVLPQAVDPISEETSATGLPPEPLELATFDQVRQEAAAVNLGSIKPPAEQPSSLHGSQAVHAEQSLHEQSDESTVSQMTKASGDVYTECSRTSVASPAVQPETGGEGAAPDAAVGQTGSGSCLSADRSEAPQETIPKASPAAPRWSSSGGVRALAAMFEQRRSLDGPPPAPPARLRGPASTAALSAPSQQLPEAPAQPRQADALLRLGSAGHARETSGNSQQPSQGAAEQHAPVQQSQPMAAENAQPLSHEQQVPGPAAAAEQGSALVKPAVPLPASVFAGGHGEPSTDPFADLLAGFGEAFAPRQLTVHNQSTSSADGAIKAPEDTSAEPGAALPAAEPIEIPPGAVDADAAASVGSGSSLADASASLGNSGAAAAASTDYQPSVRMQGIQTDDSEAGVPGCLGGFGVPAEGGAAAAADLASHTPSSNGLYGGEDMSANSSCFTSPALSPRMVRSSFIKSKSSCVGYVCWCQMWAASTLVPHGRLLLIADFTAG